MNNLGGIMRYSGDGTTIHVLHKKVNRGSNEKKREAGEQSAPIRCRPSPLSVSRLEGMGSAKRLGQPPPPQKQPKKPPTPTPAQKKPSPNPPPRHPPPPIGLFFKSTLEEGTIFIRRGGGYHPCGTAPWGGLKIDLRGPPLYSPSEKRRERTRNGSS